MRFTTGKVLSVHGIHDPKDASAETTDWDKFIEVTEKMAYDSKKFSGGALFKEVGTGVAGDLLFTC